MKTILFVNFVFNFSPEANPLANTSLECHVKGKPRDSLGEFFLSIVHKKISRHCRKPTLSCLVNIVASFIRHISLSILVLSETKVNKRFLKKSLLLTLKMNVFLSKTNCGDFLVILENSYYDGIKFSLKR